MSVRHPERLDPHRLIYGTVSVVKRFRAWKGQPLWTLVAEITGHGSTYSMEICEDIGFDPHHKIGDPLERRPEPPARPAQETSPALPHLDTCGLKNGGSRCTCGLETSADVCMAKVRQHFDERRAADTCAHLNQRQGERGPPYCADCGVQL